MIVFGPLGVVGAILAYVALRVSTGIATKEATGWMTHKSRRIVRKASAKLPEPHRARWLEEMEADVAEFADRPLAGMVHAVHAAASARRLARELEPVVVGAATTGNSTEIRVRREPALSLFQIGAKWFVRLRKLLAFLLRPLAGPLRLSDFRQGHIWRAICSVTAQIIGGLFYDISQSIRRLAYLTPQNAKQRGAVAAFRLGRPSPVRDLLQQTVIEFVLGLELIINSIRGLLGIRQRRP